MRTHFILTAGELTWQYRRALETAVAVHTGPTVLWAPPELHPIDAPEGVEKCALLIPDWLKGASPQAVYDCMALQVLLDHGGMVLGLDTISIRDATDLRGDHALVMGSDWPANRPSEGCEHPYNNHLLARRGAGVLREMLREAEYRVRNGDERWGATGPLLLTEFAERDDVGIAPFPTLCGWEGNTIGRFYAGEEPGPDVRVIHLFSSAYPEQYASFQWPRSSSRRAPAGRSRPRLHLLSLPHTQTTSQYLSCAYTQKVVKFCRMMEGHYDVVLYAGEHNDAPCVEHVQLVSEKERAGWFGDGFDTVLTPLSWLPSEPYWQVFNGRAIAEIAKRVEKGDLILLCTGTQRLVADAFPHGYSCEPFVGYEGIETPFCAFESSSFMHTVYAKRDIGDGRNFDAVIPNFFDPDEFPETGERGGDYLLYVGRILRRKGVTVATAIAHAVGMKLVVAGPGALQWSTDQIVAPDVTMEGCELEYVGEVGVQKRAELMRNAHALLAPTSYLEPFGGVAVEAQFCGTPAITTDWGAFRETVREGRTGFRVRTLQQAVDAVAQAETLDPVDIVRLAHQHYSLDAVRPMFLEWFDRINTLWGQGWYELKEPPQSESLHEDPTDAREKVPA